MGMTIAEKIMARNAGLAKVHPGQYLDAKIDRIIADEEFYRIHAAAVAGGLEGGVSRIWDQDRFHVILEHFQPPLNETQAIRQQNARRVAKQYGLKDFNDTTCGVIQQLSLEYYAIPGEFTLGADSHTCSLGALNCAGTGMGEHELAYALCFGELWFRVPASVKIILEGKLSKWADAKDIVLYLAQKYTASFGLYKSLEFTGPGAHELSIAQRMTVAVHAVELGAKFGIFEYDEKTSEFLRQRTRLQEATAQAQPVSADPDAEYEQVITLDLSEIEPLVAKPHTFENVAPLHEVAGTRIDQAQVGSCANGRLEDIRAVAEVLKGKKINPTTRFFVQPASWTVYRACMKENLFDIILDAGAQILSPGCHLCLGMQGRLGENENAITSTTRNHMGRLGGYNCNVYLANPKVVAAAALAGCIPDLREEG